MLSITDIQLFRPILVLNGFIKPIAKIPFSYYHYYNKTYFIVMVTFLLISHNFSFFLAFPIIGSSLFIYHLMFIFLPQMCVWGGVCVYVHIDI